MDGGKLLTFDHAFSLRGLDEVAAGEDTAVFLAFDGQPMECPSLPIFRGESEEDNVSGSEYSE